MRYVAIGDSFTEGVGDELADGTLRGWADLVAQGIAASTGESVEYANLAIRGRLLGSIVGEQLEPALALKPTMITLSGGGNDILRPGSDLAALTALIEQVIDRCAAEGVRLVLLSGGNPTGQLPSGARVRDLGDRYTQMVSALAAKRGLVYVNNWTDTLLAQPQYWSADRLHLNAAGHHRIAARVLDRIGFAFPSEWMTPQLTSPPPPSFGANVVYYRRHVLPWLVQRATGRSSGDGRSAKYAEWQLVEPG
ncbi:MAG: SGNH/GDSL hydrolase family protein [Microbacteriaceae bacterium]